MERERQHSISSTTFTIASKYTDLKAIGKGSYGVVVSALDQVTNMRVAIKKITPMAKHTVDAKHILREVRIMRYMGRHENIVTLKDLHVREQADELYIVMELMDSDLHRVLQSKQALTEAHFRHFLFQLLAGLKHLHNNRVIHRDLKPGNLLVTRDCRLRITDFGLARERPTGAGPDPDDEIIEPMTEHVVTRWYRPPELMLCPDGLYTYAVDLWSVGCIFAEMLGRKPLFPGKNFVHQLSLIFDVIGTPTRLQVSHIKNVQAKKFLDSQSGKDPASYTQVFPHASAEALELLERLLLFDPEQRFNVDEALSTRFLENASRVDSPSLVFPENDDRCEFEFERNGSSKYQLKNLIIEESVSLKQERGIPAQHGSASIAEGSKTSVSKTQNIVTSGVSSTRGIRGANKENRGIATGNAAETRAAAQSGAASTAKPRPASASSTKVVSSGYGQVSRRPSAPKRPSSASATASQAAPASRMPKPHDEADKALAAARAWLSAAAAASDGVDISTAVAPARRDRTRRMDAASATRKAMNVLQSPTRLQQDRFKGSPKRFGVAQQRTTRQVPDLPHPSESLLQDAPSLPPRPISAAAAPKVRRPLTVAKSPKFSVMKRTG